MGKIAPKNHRTDKVESRIRAFLEDEIDQETVEKVVGIATNALEASKKRENYFHQKALQVDRKYESAINKVRGSLISCIQTHGSITKSNVNSAAKRIHGEILQQDFTSKK